MSACRCGNGGVHSTEDRHCPRCNYPQSFGRYHLADCDSADMRAARDEEAELRARVDANPLPHTVPFHSVASPVVAGGEREHDRRLRARDMGHEHE